MKLEEVRKLSNCPEWLKDPGIQVKNEDIEISNAGTVIWKNGTWIYGTWENGIWLDGTWSGGTWLNGDWYNGTWNSGNWKNGTWNTGTWRCGMWEGGHWRNGSWYGGTWKDGTWHAGFWHNGIWENGHWYSGLWRGGIWKNGWKSIGYCKWRVLYNSQSKSISIGCITYDSVEYWDEFFASDEELETKRGTPEFEQIHKSYKLAKMAIELGV